MKSIIRIFFFALSFITILPAVSVAQNPGPESPAQDHRTSDPTIISFGFSGYGYEVFPSDLVFTDPNNHLIPVVGFRVSGLFNVASPLALYMDGEYLLSNVVRTLGDATFYANTLTGYQVFVGPALRFRSAALYAAIGKNRVQIPESTLRREYSNGGGIYYYGTDGTSSLWAHHMNLSGFGGNTETDGGSAPTVPRFSNDSPALLFGLTFPLFPIDETASVRLSIDYIPVFNDFESLWRLDCGDSTRHTFRVTLGVGG